MGRRAPARRSRTRTAAVAVAAAFATLCAGPVTADVGGESPTVRADTSVGGYLAARHAHEQRDFAAAADLLLDALRLSPDQPVLLQRAHQALLLDGRVDEAAEIAIRAAAQKVDLPYGGLALTVDALVDGDADTAAALAAGLSESGIDRLLAPLLRAWTLVAAEQPEAARQALSPLAGVRGAEVLHRLQVALVADVIGDDVRAEAEYAAALAAAENPTVRAIQLVGNFFERHGRGDEALALYQSYLDRRPDSVIAAAARDRLRGGGATRPPIIGSAADGAAEALFDVAGAIASENTQEAALITARLGLALRPDFPMLQALTARLLETLERYADANTVYATIDPQSPLAWEIRISIADNLDRLDRFDKAEALLREMADERPDSAEPYIELGDLLRRHERFREAVDAYDAAFERLPDAEARHWGLYYARGIALERSKMWDRAERDFLKALDLEPDQPFVLNYLGYSWVEQGRNLERALEMIGKAVAARPQDGFITDSLGWAHYRLGNYDEAVEHLERAVLLQPEDPVINDHLGDAYWRVGRLREARFRWTAALGLDPEPDLRAAIEAKLESGLAAVPAPPSPPPE